MSQIKILYRTQSKYHDIRVEEEYPIRTLLFGNGLCAEQSAINIEKPSSYVFDYSFLIMHSLLINPYPSNILVVGLGGGVIPREMEKYASNSKVDVIEIDPEVLKVAQEYFFFKEKDNLKVHIGDAFDVVKSINKIYDMIIIDVFLTNYTPFHIMSREFFKSVFDILADDGVVAVNMANSHPSFYSQINTIRDVFGDVLYYLNGHRNPNTTILFALKKEKEIIQLNNHPLCHFLSVQPERLNITDEIKNAKIFSILGENIV